MNLRRSVLFLLSVLLVGALWGAMQITAQVAPPADLFVPLQTIGETRPSGRQYDPVYDRFAWVDPQGQLVLVNATTLQTEHVLYESGAFEALAFSRNGGVLAVASGDLIEVWDTENGTLVARFEPPANRVQGPLQFTRDDELLVFDSVVPAPQELRRSENDTILLPWVWDVAAARGLRRSVLANRADAVPFYSTRVSMIAGDNGVIVTGLDNRIQVFDVDTPTGAMITEVTGLSRVETDPLVAWRSATDPYLYIQLDAGGRILQIDTRDNHTQTLLLGRGLRANALNTAEAIPFSRASHLIGGNSTQINPLTQTLLGPDYAQQQNYEPGTFMLVDVLIPLNDNPASSPAGQTALLTYTFAENTGQGALELIRPPDVGQIALSPDENFLALRRLSAEQPVEIYRIASGALERLFVPAERDPNAQYPFAFTSNDTLLIDFERVAFMTGTRIARAEQYTQPFDAYAFNQDNQLITFGGTRLDGQNGFEGALTWRLWEPETGQLLRDQSFPITGELLSSSEDGLRLLVREDSQGSLTLRIIDLSGDEADTYRLPLRHDLAFNSVTPNADWSRFLVTYSSSDPVTGGSLFSVEVFARSGEQLYFDAGNNLLQNAYSVTWRDADTIQIEAGSYTGAPASPTLGIVYHPSGLPQCVVDALPTQWRSLIPVWERVQFENQTSALNVISADLCAALAGEPSSQPELPAPPALTPDAATIVALLTPTPGVYYSSARTPAPIAIPGVPACITLAYQREAIAYADLWRTLTAQVSDQAQLAELEIMVCEGLINSLNAVQPTATINPDTLALATPTPMEAAPVTTGGDEGTSDIMLIDVRTGERTFIDNSVLLRAPARIEPETLLGGFFNQQYGVFPQQLVISPDGSLMAARTDAGFVALYRLTRPYARLLAEEQNAVVARETQGPRSIGLAPTGTLPPQALGPGLPTLTPTMTLTAFPLPEATTSLPEWGQETFICPARTTVLLEQAAAGFAPPGELLVQPIDTTGTTRYPFTLNPRTGLLVADTALPCGEGVACNRSPDGEWVLQQRQTADGMPGEIVIVRANGSDATTLYTETDVQQVAPYFQWRAPHTLEIVYSGIVPTRSAYPTTLVRTYDPETGVRSEGAVPTTVPTLGPLPFQVIATQPHGTLEIVSEQTMGDTRYLLRDTTTGEAEVFAQGNFGFEWQPTGHFLYYQTTTGNFLYDTQSGQHARISRVPAGVWSPNGRLRADWTRLETSQKVETFLRGDLPPLLQVWDSETGLMRAYCFPGSYQNSYEGTTLVWSPDNRYLAFVVTLPLGGDLVPTPTPVISPEAPPPTSTPVPLEVRYDQQLPRTFLLDTETGSITEISRQAAAVLNWIEEEGS